VPAFWGYHHELCGLKGRPFQLLPGILGMPQLEGRRELRRRMDGGMEESMICGPVAQADFDGLVKYRCLKLQ